MAEFGFVKKIIGEEAEVALTRSEACKHCNACLPSLTDKTMILKAQNKAGAKIGDKVAISVTQSGFLSAIAILYSIPAVVFILLIIILSLLKLNEWIIVGAGVVGVAIAYLVIHRLAPRLDPVRYIPVIEEILEDAASVTCESASEE